MTRVFQVLEDSTNACVAGNQTWRRNLYEPLIELEHEVVLFSARAGRLAMQRNSAPGRAAFSQKLLETFRREHAQKPFALFFAYLMDGMVEPGALDEIRKSGVPTCNFSCNNAHQFDLVDELSPHFDYNLHSEKDARTKFLAIGANPLWWPMASNPKYFKPLDLPRTVATSFVGANYALRPRYLLSLLENGIDAHAYGPGWQWGSTSRWRSQARRCKYWLMAMWPGSLQQQYRGSANLADHDVRRSVGLRFPHNVHPPVSDDELIALYSRSHVSLGFLEVYEAHDASRPLQQHLHLREFEAPMSGALYCTGFTDELAECFEPAKEILVYRNAHELLDQVRYYLAHPDEGERIRQAGHARAIRDHTYTRRFETLFRELRLEGR
jgi:spore maturation protein CgeB